MIHPLSGPFVRQGLAAAQQRPLSPTRVIETWLTKAELLRLSPNPSRPLPQPPSGRLGAVSIRVCVLPGAQGRPESVTWWVGGAPHLARAWVTLGPAVEVGREAPPPESEFCMRLQPGLLCTWGDRGPEKGGE